MRINPYPILSTLLKVRDCPDPSIESEILPDGKIVKIRGISAKTTYEVQLEYETPQELQSVVDTPVLSLELRSPLSPEREMRKENPPDAD